MTKLNLQIPTVGEFNTAAEPKVDTALKEIEEWANGKVGTANIEAGTITEAMLATAVQEKLGGTIFGLTYTPKGESYEAKNGEWVFQTKAASTTTLPTPTASRVVAVYNATGGHEDIKIKASSGKIFGDFLSVEGATELTLASNQHLTVEANGTGWFIIAGEPKREQKYKELGELGFGPFTPSTTRPVFANVSINKPVAAAPNGVVIRVGGNTTALLGMPPTAEGFGVQQTAGMFVPPGQAITLETGNLAACQPVKVLYIVL